MEFMPIADGRTVYNPILSALIMIFGLSASYVRSSIFWNRTDSLPSNSEKKPTVSLALVRICITDLRRKAGFSNHAMTFETLSVLCFHSCQKYIPSLRLGL